MLVPLKLNTMVRIRYLLPPCVVRARMSNMVMGLGDISGLENSGLVQTKQTAADGAKALPPAKPASRPCYAIALGTETDLPALG